jgi:hypothetical protein
MTIYIQIHEGESAPARLPPDLWHPWIHCTDLRLTIQLALHKRIRERGGVREKLTVRVYAVPGAEINDGRPRTAFCTVFHVSPN